MSLLIPLCYSLVSSRKVQTLLIPWTKWFFAIIISFLVLISLALSDDVDNMTVTNDDLNFTTIDIMESNINISSITFYNNSSDNESDIDVSTELESTKSTTEQIDDSKSQSNGKNFIFLTPDEDICNCDLTFNACDINCCCDLDCGDEEKQVFSECSHQVLTPDTNYCYQKDIVFRNNTVYKLVKDPDSAMFCIVHDNFKHHLRFKDMPILKYHRDVSFILNYKHQTTYSWNSESDDIFEPSGIKAGNPILIDVYSHNMSSHWHLPSSCLSDICSCEEKVLYLQDFKSTCSHIINLQKECDTNKILSGETFVSFCVNPKNAPGHTTERMVDLILHAKTLAGNDSVFEYYSSEVCVNKNTLKPRGRSNVCQNIVKSVDFVVMHDGVNGINKIAARYKYIDVSMDQNFITQSYSVSFIWSNVTVVENKSGNPGYNVGFPILTAINASDVGTEEVFMVQGKLSIFDRSISSICSENRQIIKFGKNFKTGCYLPNTFTNCKSLLSKLSSILLGSNKKEIFVGIFGNANSSDINDWIEVFYEGLEILETNEKCFVSLGLNINIIYAAVGSVANPQYKIVGVLYQHTKPEFVDFSCLPNCNDILLSSSVSFFDVTLRAVHHYAKVPSIKANLPSDFFYPFLYGHSTKHGANISNMLLLCIVLLLFFNKIVSYKA